MKKILFSILAAFLLSFTANAQNPGDLDTDFGVNGFALTDGYANTAEVFLDMIVLPNDKIIKVGYTNTGPNKDVLIARFKANGSIDKTFGNNGFQKIDFTIGSNEYGRGVIDLPNGKLLVTGYFDNNGLLDAFIMRLNSDGTMDNSFGTSNGYTAFNTGDNTVAVGNVILNSGSEIYVGGIVEVNGSSDIMLANFTMGGGIDQSFSSQGFATMDINGGNEGLFAMDQKANGAFVFGGYSDDGQDVYAYVASLTQFGTPSSFGNGGSFVFGAEGEESVVTDLFVDDNDRTVFTGYEGSGDNLDGFVQRLTSNGDLDNSFANGGIITSDPGNTTGLYFTGINESANGDIVVSGFLKGSSYEVYAMYLDNEGKLNTNFGGNGDVIIPMPKGIKEVRTTSSALQSDGSAIIGGFVEGEDFTGQNIFITRLHPEDNNTSIFEMNEQVVTVYPNPTSGSFKIDMKQIEQVQLMNMQGQKIANWNAQYNYQIPAGIPAGVYLLQIKSKNGLGVTRLTIN